MAVVRMWHGKVPLDKGDEYEKFLIERAVPDYGSIEGLEKLYFTRKDDSEFSHFLLITIWDSMSAVRKFAGQNPELAKYYPEDDHYLVEKEKYVRHYEIFYEK